MRKRTPETVGDCMLGLLVIPLLFGSELEAYNDWFNINRDRACSSITDIGFFQKLSERCYVS